MIVVFEGRDAAGKGGTIKAITERVSPRVFRVVALPAPSDREKSADVPAALRGALPGGGRDRDLRPQLVQPRRRRIRHGLLHAQAAQALSRTYCPVVEKFIIDGGIRLIKFWLEVGQEEQERRFQARIDDPLRQWKLSPMDIESSDRWYDYSRARDMMLEHTDTDYAPWHIVHSDDKKRARLNVIAHILTQIPYKKVDQRQGQAADPFGEDKYDDRASIAGRRRVEQRY